MPPITAATNAFKPSSTQIVWAGWLSPGYFIAYRNPAAAASADPSTNVNDTTRSTGMPIRAAVVGL